MAGAGAGPRPIPAEPPSWEWVSRRLPAGLCGRMEIKMGTVLAFFATGTGQTAMVAAALWALGCFGKSAWYEKFREALGRGAEAAGVAVSALGNSKLKLLWD